MTRLPATFRRAATVDGHYYPAGSSAELDEDTWRRLHVAGAILTPAAYAEHLRHEQIEREAKDARDAEDRARQRREAAEERARVEREAREAEDARRAASDELHRRRGDVRVVWLAPIVIDGTRREPGSSSWVTTPRYHDLHARGLARALDPAVEAEQIERHRASTVQRLRREAEAGDESARAALEALGEAP